jgi:hypothetical protein
MWGEKVQDTQDMEGCSYQVTYFLAACNWTISKFSSYSVACMGLVWSLLVVPSSFLSPNAAVAR